MPCAYFSTADGKPVTFYEKCVNNIDTFKNCLATGSCVCDRPKGSLDESKCLDKTARLIKDFLIPGWTVREDLRPNASLAIAIVGDLHGAPGKYVTLSTKNLKTNVWVPLGKCEWPPNVTAIGSDVDTAPLAKGAWCAPYQYTHPCVWQILFDRTCFGTQDKGWGLYPAVLTFLASAPLCTHFTAFEQAART